MARVLREHEVLRERSLREAWEAGGFRQMEREREEHSDRRTVKAKARRLEVQGMLGQQIILCGSVEGSWWAGRYGSEEAGKESGGLTEFVSWNCSLKIKVRLAYCCKMRETQEIIFKKEI